MFIIGEEVISSPRISVAIPGKEIVIEGDYKKETANQFVDRINSQ